MKTFLLLVNAERALCQIEWKKLRDGTNHSSVFLVVDLHITYPIGVALQHLYLGIIPLSKTIGRQASKRFEMGSFHRFRVLLHLIISFPTQISIKPKMG